jgi:hypothetical protein
LILKTQATLQSGLCFPGIPVKNAFSSASASRPQTLFRGTEASRQTNAKYSVHDACPIIQPPSKRAHHRPFRYTCRPLVATAPLGISRQLATRVSEDSLRHSLATTREQMRSPRQNHRKNPAARVNARHDHGLGLRRQFVEYPAEFLFGPCIRRSSAWRHHGHQTDGLAPPPA